MQRLAESLQDPSIYGKEACYGNSVLKLDKLGTQCLLKDFFKLNILLNKGRIIQMAFPFPRRSWSRFAPDIHLSTCLTEAVKASSFLKSFISHQTIQGLSWAAEAL